MASLWITYAWADNRSGDIDFVAQELASAGLEVKLDRWNIKVGVRLWEQIAEFIQSPAQCDAWMLIATQTSLGSEPCREEYTYALDRALNSRGGAFPVIALFPATVDQALVPAGIRTRLHVSLRDPDWKERIVAAAENRDVNVQRPSVTPYHLTVHRQAPPSQGYLIEVRPRAGSWSPFVAAVPLLEKDHSRLNITHAASGRPQTIGFSILFGAGEGTNEEWAFCFAQNEATPTMSYYLSCANLPTKLLFGADGGVQYIVESPGR